MIWTAPAGDKPAYEQLLRYARTAVRNEHIDPRHAAGYERASAALAMLMHFPQLTASDHDARLIHHALSAAEFIEEVAA